MPEETPREVEVLGCGECPAAVRDPMAPFYCDFDNDARDVSTEPGLPPDWCPLRERPARDEEGVMERATLAQEDALSCAALWGIEDRLRAGAWPVGGVQSDLRALLAEVRRLRAGPCQCARCRTTRRATP